MRRTWIAAAAISALACARAAGPPVDGPSPTRLRGLDFSVDLEVTDASTTALGGRVRITNRGTTPETLVFADGCPVRLRIYDVEGQRVAPVWEGPVTCPAEPVAVAIASGESTTLEIPATSASEILRGGLPDGAYRITVWLVLVPDDRVIEVEAGEVALTATQ